MMRGILYENMNSKKIKKPDENVEETGEKSEVKNKRNPVTTAAKAAGVVVIGTVISLGAISAGCGSDKGSQQPGDTEVESDLGGVVGQ